MAARARAHATSRRTSAEPSCTAEISIDTTARSAEAIATKVPRFVPELPKIPDSGVEGVPAVPADRTLAPPRIVSSFIIALELPRCGMAPEPVEFDPSDAFAPSVEKLSLLLS